MFKRMGTFKREEQIEMEHMQEHLSGVDVKDVPTDEDADVATSNTASTNAAADVDIETLTDRNAEWRKTLRSSMKPKERTAIERVQMPELDPVYRATTTPIASESATRVVSTRKASLPTLALQPRRILWKTSSTVSPSTIPMPRF